MNVYALFPIIAIAVYIPLLITTASSRPWNRRHTLFILFLIPAMLWSLVDVFLRSNIFSHLNFLFLQLIILMFSVMAVQFHCFLSSFYGPGKGRWLPFAYTSLVVIIILVITGVVPDGV